MPLESCRILAVDDVADNLFLLMTVLEAEGYEVDTTDNGTSALELIAAKPPDLVLLDMMMPGVNGLEVTQRIRQNHNLPFIPILLVTAYEEVSALEGLDNGANGLIRKPIDFDELLASIKAVLRLKHRIDSTT